MDATPTISAIDPLPQDPNSRRIKVGRRTVGVLSGAQVELLRLRVGQNWSERLATRVEHALAVEAARRDALRMLGRTAVASATLRERLLRKEHPEKAVDATVAALLDDGWLDDRAFAVAVAEAALRRGPLGVDALAARLTRRGVDPAVAREVAAQLATRLATGFPAADGRGTPMAAVEQALRWAEASLKRAGRLSRQRAARRVAAGLARRDVDADTIGQVLQRLGLPIDDDAA